MYRKRRRRYPRRTRGPLSSRHVKRYLASKIHIPGTRPGRLSPSYFRSFGDFHVKLWNKGVSIPTQGLNGGFATYRFDGSISASSFHNDTYSTAWNALSLNNGTMNNQYATGFNNIRLSFLKSTRYELLFIIPPAVSMYVGYTIVRSRASFFNTGFFANFNENILESQDAATYNVIARKRQFVQANDTLGEQQRSMKFTIPWNRALHSAQDGIPADANAWIVPYSDKDFTWLVVQVQVASGSPLDQHTTYAELKTEHQFYSK